MAIKKFKDKKIQNYFETGQYPKNVGWKSVGAIVKRKLDMLNYAAELNDLKSPPSNHLEALKGDLKGFYSIRINLQWRVIFKWDNEPFDVDITDYH